MAKKFKLDQATKDAMVGLYPCNNDFTVNHIPEEYKDLPVELQPTFVLKPWCEKQCKAMAKEYETTPDQDSILDKVRQQIVGLSNMVNLSTEEETTFMAEADGGLSKATFTLLPIVVKTSLLYKLLKISGIQR
jgi:hypothetical protein